MDQMNPTASTTNLTPGQLLVRGYVVPVALILTGTALGWYLARRKPSHAH